MASQGKGLLSDAGKFECSLSFSQSQDSSNGEFFYLCSIHSVNLTVPAIQIHTRWTNSDCLAIGRMRGTREELHSTGYSVEIDLMGSVSYNMSVFSRFSGQGQSSDAEVAPWMRFGSFTAAD